MTDVDYTDDLALLTNTLAESLLHILEQASIGTGLFMNADKTKTDTFLQRTRAVKQRERERESVCVCVCVCVCMTLTISECLVEIW